MTNPHNAGITKNLYRSNVPTTWPMMYRIIPNHRIRVALPARAPNKVFQHLAAALRIMPAKRCPNNISQQSASSIRPATKAPSHNGPKTTWPAPTSPYAFEALPCVHPSAASRGVQGAIRDARTPPVASSSSRTREGHLLQFRRFPPAARLLFLPPPPSGADAATCRAPLRGRGAHLARAHLSGRRRILLRGASPDREIFPGASGPRASADAAYGPRARIVRE